MTNATTTHADAEPLIGPSRVLHLVPDDASSRRFDDLIALMLERKRADEKMPRLRIVR